MTEYTILPEWKDKLTEAGLDTLDSLLNFAQGKCVSKHRRGATFRYTLADGTVIFIKRDHFTFKKEMAKDFLRLRWPAQKTVKERKAFQIAQNAGLIAPKVIAWGTSTKFGLPDKAAFISLEICGTNLDEFVRQHGRDATQKEIARAEDILCQMQQKGLDWPDHKPEHFIVMPDGEIALIDLERLQQRKSSLSAKHSAKQLKRFRALLPQ